MIKNIFRRKLLVAILLCLFLGSNAVITNSATHIYAKKANQENVVSEKANYQDASKQELVQLILSLKNTIESLDSRLANIESKLDVITSKDSQPKISEKWRDFSAKQQKPQEQEVVVEQKNDPTKKLVEETVEVDTIVVETVNKEKVQLKSDKAVEKEQSNQVTKNVETKTNVQTIAEKKDKVFLEQETTKIAKQEKPQPDSKVTKIAETKLVETVSKLEPEKIVTKQPEKKIVKVETKKVQTNKLEPKKIVKKFKYNIIAETENVKGNDVGSVSIGGMTIITYRSTAAGIDPFARAQIVAKRIENYLANGGDIKNLKPALREGMYIGSVEGNVLFTVDQNTADKSGLNIDDLTLAWVNNLRSALGASKLKRSSDMMVSRSLSAEGRSAGRGFDRSKSSNIINMLLPMTSKDTGKVLFGGASWYGPYFHGRRAADGSRYNMYAMTAAHKSLPFGTIVKVTNLNNNRTCIVKITDRGPYIHGRIIDLSKAAAQQVGMLGSGTAKVKVEIVGKVPKFRR